MVAIVLRLTQHYLLRILVDILINSSINDSDYPAPPHVTKSIPNPPFLGAWHYFLFVSCQVFRKAYKNYRRGTNHTFYFILNRKISVCCLSNLLRLMYFPLLFCELISTSLPKLLDTISQSLVIK